MITREQIAQLLKSISEAHYQIHSYGWGDVPDLLAREDVIYPFLMVTPSSSNYEEGYATHTYTISIADRVLKDKANEVNVDSDTHQILLDILSQIDNLMYDDVDVVKGGTITPFFDNFRHEVTGHFADVGIRVKFAYDSCAVPSDIVPLPLPPPFECADASYRVQYVNGTLIEEGTIVSGGSKTINVPNPSICDPADYEVRDADGNVLYSGTIASGGSENIVVTNSTVVVRKSDNTIISSVSVLAQGSANYQVADSVITLKDTSAATLSTTNVKATDPATIVAPNGTLNVNKSDGVLISGQVVKSGETKGYNVADSVVSNSNSSYSANVKATDPLTLPDQQINVNSVDQGDIPSVGTIDINITDGVNPVVPNSVVITGRTVDIEVPSGGGTPSGILFDFPRPQQRVSFRTGDEGWRVQNGWYDYTPPTMPAAIAELDLTSTNFPYVLKNPLIVNGVSSTIRFVDVNGVQVFSGVNNADKVVIDKLTGIAWVRTRLSSNSWNNQIDAALAYSETINSVLYNDFYLASGTEHMSLVFGRAASGNLVDSSSSVVLISNLVANFFTSTTCIDTLRAYYLENAENILQRTLKTNSIFGLMVSKEFMNLITAP